MRNINKNKRGEHKKKKKNQKIKVKHHPLDIWHEIWANNNVKKTTTATLAKSTSALHNAIPMNSLLLPKQRASNFWLLPHFKIFNIQHKYRLCFCKTVATTTMSTTIHTVTMWTITTNKSTSTCNSVRLHVCNIFMRDNNRCATHYDAFERSNWIIFIIL